VPLRAKGECDSWRFAVPVGGILGFAGEIWNAGADYETMAESSSATFVVGVHTENTHSFGRLTVSARRAELKSWPTGDVLAVHTARCVPVVCPRINFFGRRTLFVLKDGAAVFGVRGDSRRLCAALKAAGFELEERHTFFDIRPRPPFWASRVGPPRRAR
jgi:hypothetical protein